MEIIKNFMNENTIEYHSSIIYLCINLKRSAERRKKIEAEKIRAGVDVEFVDAVDGRELSYEMVPEYDREKRLKYDKDLTLGEVACVLSHRKALQRFLASGAEYGVILEDDISFCEGFREKFQELIPHLQRLDMIKLFHDRFEPVVRFGKIGGHELIFPKNLGENTGAIAYSRAGAEKILQNTQLFNETMDLMLFYISQLKVISIHPNFVNLRDDNVTSTIEEFGSRAKSRPKRPFWMRMRRRRRKLLLQLCRLGQVRATKKGLRGLM